MTKLILTLGGQPIGQFKLDKERMTIGRKPHNDIRIDNLAVSGEHAAIFTLGNDSFVEDLDSTERSRRAQGERLAGANYRRFYLELE